MLALALVGVLARPGAGRAAVGAARVDQAAACGVRAAARRHFGRRGHAPRELRDGRGRRAHGRPMSLKVSRDGRRVTDPGCDSSPGAVIETACPGVPQAVRCPQLSRNTRVPSLGRLSAGYRFSPVGSPILPGTLLAPRLRLTMASSILDSSVLSSCRVCGWATLPGSTLCVGCLDIREWSRVNRAFCELLHRTQQPIERTGGRAEMYASSRFALTA